MKMLLMLLQYQGSNTNIYLLSFRFQSNYVGSGYTIGATASILFFRVAVQVTLSARKLYQRPSGTVTFSSS
jgi:hypothetical protein